MRVFAAVHDDDVLGEDASIKSSRIGISAALEC